MTSPYFSLGKEAARRATAQSKTIKVFKPGGEGKIQDALKKEPSSARQVPWSYGEKRKRRKDVGKSNSEH